jgi:DNA-binding transcriptional LysR family regulator
MVRAARLGFADGMAPTVDQCIRTLIIYQHPYKGHPICDFGPNPFLLTGGRSMDTEQIKTFLRVVDTGGFAAAAAKLGITQSTVLSRIKELELDVGNDLFVRHKNGASLSVAGRGFLPHAQVMMKAYREACRGVATDVTSSRTLSFGGPSGSWTAMLGDWLAKFSRKNPDVAVTASIDTNESLAHRVRDGSLDFAVVPEPAERSGLKLEKLCDQILVMVSSSPDSAGVRAGNYIFIDWGPAFATWHEQQVGPAARASLRVNQGSLGGWLALRNGGACYLPQSYMIPGVITDRLYPVRGAPVYVEAHYIAVAETASNPALGDAIELLKAEAAALVAADVIGMRRKRA